MFSNALKSFTSNINSNYILSPQPISTSGPWRIHDAKKKSTGQAVSVFVFDRRSLEPPSGASSGLSLRSSSSSSGLKVIQEEVVERLKREASSLARLRHPAILELVEPVEETRSGGLQFVTEQVTGSLGHALKEKDEAERNAGRGSRFVVDDGQGSLRRREVEIDELDIQKGLLQIAKGLEFLHESAGLTHCNLTPEAVYINAKSDWKLSALAFATAHGSADERSTTSVHGLIAQDPRLPLSVQLSYDYTSPDLLLDFTLSPSVDLFSLGLLIVALYNSPHESPLQTHNSASTYKRLLSSPSTTPNAGNGFLSTRPLPKLMPDLLSRLLTRRPANRLTAREFQQNSYFDNILVSTLRFLESLPAKTTSEKSSFMRGLLRVLPQFPKSVLEKKVLPILVEELKDKELLPFLLPNIFSIIDNTPGGSRLFSERVLKRLKNIYLPNGPSELPRSPTPTPIQATSKKTTAGIGSSLESGLVVILDHLPTIIAKTTATEFKEDILPLIYLALESPTHSLQDRALQSLETILPALDFPTVKNEFFPVVASVFAKTSSLGIKIRGLQAFKVLCGGAGGDSGDGLDGGAGKARGKGAGVALDKYTVQEKMVPLLKGIKTKEPGVMMAALDAFTEVGRLCDREVLATEIIPVLWSMSLGPLLNLEQFQAFMSAIKAQSHKIEQEQTQKLKELSTSSGAINANGTDFLSFGGLPGARAHSPNGELEFEKLVLGKEPETGKGGEGLGDWGWSGQTALTTPTRPLVQTQTKKAEAPKFEWSTPSPTIGSNMHGFGSIGAISSGQSMGMSMSAMKPTTGIMNGSTNLPSFSTLQPIPASNIIGMGMSTMQPLQPSKPTSTSSFGSAGFGSMNALRPQNSTTSGYTVPRVQSSSGIDWSGEAKKPSFPSNTTTLNSSTWGPATAQQLPSSTRTQSNVYSSFNQSPSSPNLNGSHPTILFGQTRMQAPPSAASGLSAFKLAPPPSASSSTIGMSGGLGQQQQPKTGLDAWESLL
ncbi:kinase-like domain-containing protein [Tirmania nivea]|nr:kinase-like domain-containing protein [Tirmania nivea]